MSNHHKHTHSPYCLNCHYPTAEFDSFCPNCGQKNTDGKTSMHDLWHEFVHSWLHVDGKIFNTLFAIFKPGKLTEQFFKGRHKRYVHPIQLLFVIGGLYILLSIVSTNSIAKTIKTTLNGMRDQALHRKMIERMDTITSDLVLQNPKSEAYIDTIQNRMVLAAKKDFRSIVENIMNRDTASSFKKGYDLGKNSAENDTLNGKSDEKNKNYQKGKNIGSSFASIIWGKRTLKKDTLDNLRLKPMVTNTELKLGDIDDRPEGIPLLGMYVGFMDIELLTGDELVEKYHPQNWKQTILLKQTARFIQDGGNFFGLMYSKMFWGNILAIFPLSWLMGLLYKKRLMVEHLVFWLHMSSAYFFLNALTMLPNLLGSPIWLTSILGVLAFILFHFVYTPLALDKYYGEVPNRVLKIFTVIFLDILFGLIATLLSVVVSAAMF
jgi:Protein of unknown function (DUF3667)